VKNSEKVRYEDDISFIPAVKLMTVEVRDILQRMTTLRLPWQHKRFKERSLKKAKWQNEKIKRIVQQRENRKR